MVPTIVQNGEWFMPTPIFKDNDYHSEPFRVLGHYVEQQVQHLKRKHPNLSVDQIESIVKRIAKDRVKDPKIQRITFPTPGNHKKEIVSTTQHLKDIEGNITSPSGNTYCPPTRKESFIRLTIIDNIKQRGAFKKKMGAAKEQGDAHMTAIYDNLQKSKKISNNSTPGAMQSAFNIISDKSGFNTITSTTRLGVKTAYGTVERLLAGNIYLPTYEDALSYIYNTISVMPVETAEVLSKYSGKISIVTKEDFHEWLISNMKWYSYRDEFSDKIKAVVETLTDVERSYIFYAGSWYNLFNYNKDYFRSFVDGVFNRDIAVDPSIEASDIFKLEETLSIMVRGTNADLFGFREDGRRHTLKEAVAHNPEGIRKIVAYGRHMEAYFEAHRDLLSTFLKSRNETPQPYFNHKFVRKATILCDTDSNLFTTNEIVRLYHGLETGKTDFSPKSFDVNALSVYILCMCLEHTFARFSSRAGIQGDDCYVISMKNEFLYPTFKRTNIGKHYSGVITIQEGIILPKPQLDMKGVGYIGSTRPKIITDGVKSFMTDLFDRIVKTNAAISAEEILRHVATVEETIFESLNKGEKTYLGGVNIKQPESYKDKGERSTFYYRVWEQVFSEHFRINVVLPNRFMKIPLIGEDKLWSNLDLMAEFREKYPDVHAKMMAFREANPDKKINYLIAPASMGTIPEMFRPWISNRTVITAMCSPYYLTLKSLGISVALPEQDVLVMDYLSGGQKLIA